MEPQERKIYVYENVVLNSIKWCARSFDYEFELLNILTKVSFIKKKQKKFKKEKDNHIFTSKQASYYRCLALSFVTILYKKYKNKEII